MDKIYDQILKYSPEDKQEQLFREQMLNLLSTKKILSFKRSNLEAHFTASAWILSSDMQKVLLLLHKKLDKWLQPGGHADGVPKLQEVSLKEAKEETGLNKLKVFSDEIFDIDIHEIPERKNEQAHFHYDVRYMYICDPEEEVRINHESNDYRWIPLADIINDFENPSIVRMAVKSSKLFHEK